MDIVKNYIVFDLVAREVVYSCRSEQVARNYIDNHSEDVLLLITITQEKATHNVIGLDGCTY